MNDIFAPIVEIIRARNVIAYPYGTKDADLMAAADMLLKHSDNAIDRRDARAMKDRIRANAAARQAEALEGFDLYMPHLTSRNTGYTFWAACAVIFGAVGYIIGAVTQ